MYSSLPGINAELELARTFAEVWCMQKGVSSTERMGLGVYELKRVTPAPSASGKFRQATEADIDVVAQWFIDFTLEATYDPSPENAWEIALTKIRRNEIFVWDDNGAVSMAAKVRPTVNGDSISLVYTPPEFRGKGYASSCVASLSQHILDSGKTYCALFTDLSNSTSNKIYSRIGYKRVAEYLDIRFTNTSMF